MIDSCRLEEIVREVIERGRPLEEVWSDDLTDHERQNLLALSHYHAEYEAEQKRKRSPAQHRARRLLRTLLTPEQQRQMDVTHRGIDVIGSAGGVYRLFPNTGAVNRMERHGTRLFCVATYCWHDDQMALPPADIAIAALLLLSCDERAFLAEAHSTPHTPHEWWSGDWRRQVRAAQTSRQTLFVCRIDDAA